MDISQNNRQITFMHHKGPHLDLKINALKQI